MKQARFVEPARCRPLSAEALKTLWSLSRPTSPLAAWLRARALLMVASVAVLVWCAAAVGSLGLASLRTRPGGGRAVVGATSEALTGGRLDAGQAASGAALRPDLFAVPRAAPARAPQQPRTNPVELLGLIELQGVLGGTRPRAMVMYAKTRETVTVSVGDDLGEFKVMEIRERSVVLTWRDELFELSL